MKHLTLKQAIEQIQNEQFPNALSVVKKPVLKTIWPKIRPFVIMLKGIFVFSKKIQSYIDAFIALIDALVAAPDAKK